MLLNNQWITEESKRKLENNLRQMNKNKISKGRSKRSSRREVYSNKDLPQENWKISNRQRNTPSKRIRKRRTNTAQSQQG